MLSTEMMTSSHVPTMRNSAGVKDVRTRGCSTCTTLDLRVGIAQRGDIVDAVPHMRAKMTRTAETPRCRFDFLIPEDADKDAIA